MEMAEEVVRVLKHELAKCRAEQVQYKVGDRVRAKYGRYAGRTFVIKEIEGYGNGNGWLRCTFDEISRKTGLLSKQKYSMGVRDVEPAGV